MRHVFFATVAAIAVAAISPLAHAASLLTGDTWIVEGTDDAGTAWDGSTLVFTSQTETGKGDFEVEGYFDWVGSGGQFGRELFSGTFTADETLSISGFELIDSSGIVTAVYKGTLSDDGDTIIGDWGTGIPGDFTATRQRSKGPCLGNCL